MCAYNEEKNIENAISKIPKKILGIEKIEILVINDGSTDKTLEIAKKCGVARIVSHKSNMGIGAAFMTGIRNCISMGADVVVSVDADGESNLKRELYGHLFQLRNQKQFLHQFQQMIIKLQIIRTP